MQLCVKLWYMCSWNVDMCSPNMHMYAHIYGRYMYMYVHQLVAVALPMKFTNGRPQICKTQTMEPEHMFILYSIGIVISKNAFGSAASSLNPFISQSCRSQFVSHLSAAVYELGASKVNSSSLCISPTKLFKQ